VLVQWDGKLSISSLSETQVLTLVLWLQTALRCWLDNSVESLNATATFKRHTASLTATDDSGAASKSWKDAASTTQPHASYCKLFDFFSFFFFYVCILTSNKPQIPLSHPWIKKNPLSLRPKSKSAQKLSDRRCTGLILTLIYCIFSANDDMLYGVWRQPISVEFAAHCGMTFTNTINKWNPLTGPEETLPQQVQMYYRVGTDWRC